MTSAFTRFRNKRALVMGLGLMGGGVESVRFLHRHGAKVLATDLRDAKTLAPSIEALKDLAVEYRLGEHREADFTNAEVVIHSPAVRPDHPLLVAARARGAEVTQEMSLFIEACPALTVGITGSNGKSTTAAMCYEMLCEFGQRAQPELEGKWADPIADGVDRSKRPKVWLGGNIGTPLINRLDEIGDLDIVVLELSSFQLMDWHRIKRSCDIGVITNITPNHLDWHIDVDEYVYAKTAIFDYPRNRTPIMNYDDPATNQLGMHIGPKCKWFDPTGELWLHELGWDYEKRACRAALFGDNLLVPLAPEVKQPDHTELPVRGDLRVPGAFNWANAAAAAAAAVSAAPIGASLIKQALRRFRGVEHRLEPCGEIRGARVYNDSIATDPTATLAALSVFEQGVHLILGGASDKGAGYDKLAQRILAHGGIKALYLQGPTAGAIKQALERANQGPARASHTPPLLEFPTFEGACKAALAAARQGDVVLMSPASTSFYEYAPGQKFANFEERGRFFKEIVRAESEGRSAQ